MRIGIRSAISGLVLMSIIVSAVGVHLLWWRTANQVSQTLADTINDQIVSAVGDQLQSVTTEARSAWTSTEGRWSGLDTLRWSRSWRRRVGRRLACGSCTAMSCGWRLWTGAR